METQPSKYEVSGCERKIIFWFRPMEEKIALVRSIKKERKTAKLIFLIGLFYYYFLREYGKILNFQQTK